MNYDYCILGNGSWATALVKILTDNGKNIAWWMRNENAVQHILSHDHNPDYLSSVSLDLSKITLSSDINAMIDLAPKVLFGIPSAFLMGTMERIEDLNVLKSKKIISAVKGIIPENGLFLNEYLVQEIDMSMQDYAFITGPCHAEEVAQEKLSYLTITSHNLDMASQVADDVNAEYIHSLFNGDVMGTQVSAVLKNIYALGAGIVHGVGYGDNFLSVYTTNCFAEASRFSHLKYEVKNPNINSSAYLGDLLVTCYSLYSRNRMFGTLIGQGYSVKSAKIELGMIAEGYYASKTLFTRDGLGEEDLPIAYHIYSILWKGKSPKKQVEEMEQMFV